MCGIVGVFNFNGTNDSLRNQALDMSRKIRHRGPDWSGIYSSNNYGSPAITPFLDNFGYGMLNAPSRDAP